MYANATSPFATVSSAVPIMESISPGRENDGVNHFDTLDALAAEAKHWRCKLLFNQTNRSEMMTNADFDGDPVYLCAHCYQHDPWARTTRICLTKRTTCSQNVSRDEMQYLYSK
jgi:hypothetical protein